MLITGNDPIATYEAIFEGTGLQWLFPWPIEDRALAAINLQQTLIVTTPLILTGLAVAFAFRAGLFNIGGQGQYIMGTIAAVWVGSSFAGMPGFLHIVLAILAACLAGAIWAGIAGGLKATVGANEVISTIMLNYTAIYIGLYLFGHGGPLQNDHDKSLPVSNDVVESAHLPVFWGDPVLQGLHIGLFIALVAVGVFWLILNRSTTGYEVRAVGLNPEAARYGGMSVAKNYVLVMAVCGLFAGLAGALDILGWQFRLATNDIEISHIGFFGIAVALLGPQHGHRHGGRGAAVRRPDQRHLAAQSRPGGLRARVGVEPDATSSRASWCSWSAPTCWCSARCGAAAGCYSAAQPPPRSPRRERRHLARSRARR